jgi:hypothetical protein
MVNCAQRGIKKLLRSIRSRHGLPQPAASGD